MSQTIEVPNYWPGYVDALVNVVLNLLFLVGVFAVGLVCLNMEIIATQQQMREMQAAEALASRSGKPISPQKALPKPAPLAWPSVAPVAMPAPLPTPVPAPMPVAAPSPSPVPAEPVFPKVQEFRFSADAPAAPSALAAANGTALELRSAQSRTVQAHLSPEAHAEQITGARAVGRLLFQPQNFDSTALREVPGAAEAAKGGRWMLLAFSTADNPRLQREAFKRLGAARDALVAAGTAVNRLQLRVVLGPPQSAGDEDLTNTVFILRLPGQDTP